MTALNRHLRTHLDVFWNNDKGALFVLLNLQMRANNRNRCFPTIETIAGDTGMSERTVKRSLKFLEDIGAIAKVEPQQRVGREKYARENQNVYEIQSYAALDRLPIPILYAGIDDDNSDTRVPKVEVNGDTGVTKPKSLIVTPTSPKVINKDSSIQITTDSSDKESVVPEKPAATEPLETPPVVQEKQAEPSKVDANPEKAKRKERYDAIAKAVMEHLHGLTAVPKEKGFMWKTVHKQAKEAAALDWLEAGDIERFVLWYRKENKDASLPSSLEGFSIWLTKYAATRTSSNGSTPHKPDPNCPVCRGAGTVITKRGSSHEPAEYGKCPACMVKSEVLQ